MTKVLDSIHKNHLGMKLACLFLGVFIYTFVYNKFLVPNHFVTGGVSGLAILVNEVTGMSTTLFINICNVVLVICSFLVLGKKRTVEQLFGCIVYLIMLNITAPLAELVTFEFESKLLMIIIIAMLLGIANGLIYRPGYSTGGSDFLSVMLSEKLKVSMTKVSLVMNIIIILVSAFVFSIPIIIYSTFIIYVSNRITNMLLFGVSTSKMVYIISSKNDDIKDYIINRINTGVTILKVNNGNILKKKDMIFCIVHNAQYNKFKEQVFKIDKKAFMLTNNCYEVSGGVKYSVLPF